MKFECPICLARFPKPGWFYGFRADVWQAYALAVLAADRLHGRAGVAS